MQGGDKRMSNNIKEPLASFIKSSSFILAGGYVAKAMFPVLRINDVINSGNCFTFAIGLILIAVGVIAFALTPFQSKIKIFFEKFNSFLDLLVPLLFVITLSRLVALISEFGINFTLVGVIIIALALLIGIIFSWEKKRITAHHLVYMSGVLLGYSTITIFLSDFDHVLLIKISLGLSFVLILFAVYLMQKDKEKT
jgi:hypothetical protein